MKIILASRSPRRRELLARICPEFEIFTRDTDETLGEGIHPRDSVEMLALRKGAAVWSVLPSDAAVISADTLVELDGVPLGKPRDEADALKMLMSLSGRTHHVHTGIAVHYMGRTVSGVDTADVVFRAFGEDEAREYIKCGECMDKAGAYAIQGEGARFVEKYVGNFDTVVGLNLELTQALLAEVRKNDEK